MATVIRLLTATLFYFFVVLLILGDRKVFLVNGFGIGDCESNWVPYGQSCFQASPIGMSLSWPAARQYCLELGGDLASFHSPTEYFDVILVITSGERKGESFHIGLSDMRLEDTFEWSDGTLNNYTNWEGLQPDNWFGSNGEHCAEIYKSLGWNDAQCKNLRSWICKRRKGWNGYLPPTMCFANEREPNGIQLKITNTSLTIESPNFPYQYPINQNCLWIVEAEQGHRIRLEFNNYVLITDLDAFTVGEGTDPEDPDSVILHKGRFIDNHVLYSSGNHLWISWKPNTTSYNFDLDEFMTFEYWFVRLQKHSQSRADDFTSFPFIADMNALADASNAFVGLGNKRFSQGVDIGVRITLESVPNEGPYRSCSEEDYACDHLDCILPSGVCNGIADCQDLSDERSCETDKYILGPTCPFGNHGNPPSMVNITNNKTVLLTSPNFPGYYPNHLNCVWYIHAPSDLQVLMSLKYLDIQEENDTLTIGEGVVLFDGVLWRGYGKTYLRVLFSTVNDMWIVLETDWDIGAPGFVIEVESFDKNTFDLTCDRHGGFTCWTGFCLDIQGVCDGKIDCLDKSDEYECDCTTLGANDIPGDCPLPLGMESNLIKDEQITSSTFYNESHQPFYGRIRNDSYWMASVGNPSPWIQISFSKAMVISAVALQSAGKTDDGWADEFVLSFSSDGESWLEYSNVWNGDKILKTSKAGCPHVNVLEPQIQGKLFRITVNGQSHYALVGIGIELSGCEANDCDYNLVESNELRNDRVIITSGDLSILNNGYSAHIDPWSLHGTGWIPSEDHLSPWLEVHLHAIYKINAIVTQGCGNEEFWITEYLLTYGSDSTQLEEVKDRKRNQVIFEGNFDRNTLVRNQLEPPVFADRVRIIPKAWNRGICLRLELIGCPDDILQCEMGHTSCHHTRHCSYSQARIASLNYPNLYFSRGSTCTWLITSSERTYVSMTIADFDLPTFDECLSTYLSIFDGESADPELLVGSYCNYHIPPETIASGFNEVFVKFSSGTSEGAGRGFLIEYQTKQHIIVNQTTIQPGIHCPEDWWLFKNQCFLHVESTAYLRWTAAEESCKSLGGHLASVRDENDMKIVHALPIDQQARRGTKVYIGLFLNVSIGRRHWTDGRPESYTNWNVNYLQPDGGNLEACTVVEIISLHQLSEWYDIPCASEETNRYICSKPATDVEDTSWSWILPDSKYKDVFNETLFRCISGEYIQKIFVCDGHVDCYDASDEEQCTTEEGIQRHDGANGRCGIGWFECIRSGECIPITYLCDFVQHCLDNSDEDVCDYPTCDEDHSFLCANGECINKGLRCNLEANCIDKSDEDFCEESPVGFQCFDGSWIPAKAKCDGYRDCTGKNWEDEPTTECENRNFTCFEEEDVDEMIPCKTGICVSRNYRCNYGFDQYGIAKGCRDASHLRHCGDYECNEGRLKCPRSYCIDIEHICNNVMDCPNGQDEHGCDSFTCPGHYHCKGHRHCVRLSQICDGIRNCPNGDDELFCDISCPDGCVCIGLLFTCDNVKWNAEKAAMIPLTAREIHLVNADVENDRSAVEEKLFLRISWYQVLFVLDLAWNGIATLEVGTFTNSRNLRTLILANNSITLLKNGTFVGLTALLYLDISGNLLSDLHTDVFSTLKKLLFLNIIQSDIREPSEKHFLGLSSLTTLYSDDFLYCCLVQNQETVTECLPKADQFSSCEDLMRYSILRIFIWILGLSALFGNGFVILWRIRSDRIKGKTTSRVQSFLVLNLAIADGLMGVYMLIIASADMYYRDRYILYADVWTRSYLCQIAGFLATLAAEGSVLFMTVISIDRFLCIAFPFDHIKLNLKSAQIAVTSVWIVTTVLSIVPVFARGYFGDKFYGRSGVCLALPLTGEKTDGLEYSVSLFLGVNLVAFCIIFICYLSIYILIKLSSKRTKRSGSHQAEQIEFAIRMAFLVGTDCICWMPIIIIGFLTLSGVAQVPPIVYVWIAVFVLPINSSLNPYVFTILTRELKNRPFRKNVSSDNHDVKAGSTKTTSDSQESQLMKVTMDEMVKNRVLPMIEKSKIQSFLLEDLVQNGARRLSDVSLKNIREDLQIALKYLQTHRHNCGTDDLQHRVLLDKVSDGTYRAFLLLPDTQLNEEGISNERIEEPMSCEDTLKGIMNDIYDRLVRESST